MISLNNINFFENYYCTENDSRDSNSQNSDQQKNINLITLENINFENYNKNYYRSTNFRPENLNNIIQLETKKIENKIKFNDFLYYDSGPKVKKTNFIQFEKSQTEKTCKDENLSLKKKKPVLAKNLDKKKQNKINNFIIQNNKNNSNTTLPFLQLSPTISKKFQTNPTDKSNNGEISRKKINNKK